MRKWDLEGLAKIVCHKDICTPPTYKANLANLDSGISKQLSRVEYLARGKALIG